MRLKQKLSTKKEIARVEASWEFKVCVDIMGNLLPSALARKLKVSRDWHRFPN